MAPSWSRTRTSAPPWAMRWRRSAASTTACSPSPRRADRGVPRVLGQAGSRRVRRGPVQAHRQGRQGSLDPGELQPHPRWQRSPLQGGEVRHRHHCRQITGRRLRRPAGRSEQGAGRHRVHAGWHHPHGERELLQDHGLLAGGDPRQAPQHVRGVRCRADAGVPQFLGEARSRRIRRRPVQAPGQGRQGGLDPGFVQPHPRHERQAVQGGEVRHRHHRAAPGSAHERGLQGCARQCHGQRHGRRHGFQHHLHERGRWAR